MHGCFQRWLASDQVQANYVSGIFQLNCGQVLRAAFQLAVLVVAEDAIFLSEHDFASQPRKAQHAHFSHPRLVQQPLSGLRTRLIAALLVNLDQGE